MPPDTVVAQRHDRILWTPNRVKTENVHCPVSRTGAANAFLAVSGRASGLFADELESFPVAALYPRRIRCRSRGRGGFAHTACAVA